MSAQRETAGFQIRRLTRKTEVVCAASVDRRRNKNGEMRVQIEILNGVRSNIGNSFDKRKTAIRFIADAVMLMIRFARLDAEGQTQTLVGRFTTRWFPYRVMVAV